MTTESSHSDTTMGVSQLSQLNRIDVNIKQEIPDSYLTEQVEFDDDTIKREERDEQDFMSDVPDTLQKPFIKLSEDHTSFQEHYDDQCVKVEHKPSGVDPPPSCSTLLTDVKQESETKEEISLIRNEQQQDQCRKLDSILYKYNATLDLTECVKIESKVDDEGEAVQNTGPATIEPASSVSTYPCTHCNYATKSKRWLKKHLQMKHVPDAEIHVCPECDYTTKWKDYMLKHRKINHDPATTLYKCARCDFTTKWKNNLYMHRKSKHPTLELQKCTECDYTTTMQLYLERHVKYHHDSGAPVYTCEECGMTTTNKTNMAKHVRVKHSRKAKIHKCVECDFTTKWKQSLNEHMRSRHTESYVIKCAQCCYTTKCKRYLVRHVREKHDPDAEVYKCAKCSYTSKWKQHIRRHKRGSCC